MEIVIAALVAAVPATIVATATWRRVGATNGHGSVACMAEKTMDMVIGLGERMDNFENIFMRYVLQYGLDAEATRVAQDAQATLEVQETQEARATQESQAAQEDRTKE